MNRKKLLIIVSVSLLLVVVGATIFVSQSKKDNNNGSETDITKTISEYYVENGLENVAEITKNAVENYATQDKDEPAASRNARLAKYFTSDSPVYNYGLSNIDNTTTKTTAKLVSIKSWPSEGSDLCIIAAATVTLTDKLGSYSVSNKYWITLLEETDGSFTPFDIGLYDET